MGETTRDPVAAAAARLEQAVERLAGALERRLARAPEEGDAIPRAEVAALAERLDSTIARLRVALAEEQRGQDNE